MPRIWKSTCIIVNLETVLVIYLVAIVTADELYIEESMSKTIKLKEEQTHEASKSIVKE